MSKLDQQQIKNFDDNHDVKYDDLDKDLFVVAGEETAENERLSSKPYSYWKSVAKLLFKSKVFLVCLVLLITFIVLMFVVPAGKIVNPIVSDAPGHGSPAAPSTRYVFGLGLQGEDYWIQIWAGMKTTLLFAFLITVIQLVLGIVLGSIWGYYRKSDLFFIQITNLLSIVPSLIMLLFVIFLLKPGYWPVILGVSIQAWITMASTIRVQIILVKNTDYNTASMALGSSSQKIIRRNILPKILPVIVQTGTFAIPNAISLDATLSFLGFGYINLADRKKTSLGTIINNVMAGSQWQEYPHLIILPVVLITAVSVIFFLVGKVFADSLDPKNHR